MTPSTCSCCRASVSIGILVTTRNPWTKKQDTWRYCRGCASRLGEFDTSVEVVVAVPTQAKRKRSDSMQFAMQLETGAEKS